MTLVSVLKQMARVEVGIVILLFALFVALQPGVFLTLPNNSLSQCEKIGVDDCSFMNTSQSVHCEQCASVWASEFTNTLAPIIHTILYFIIAYFFIGFFPSWFARITNGTLV